MTENTDESRFTRRTALKSLSAAPFVGLGAATAMDVTATSERTRIVVEQGGNRIPVTPLTYGDRTVEEFYSYGSPDGASANTPTNLEKSDTSQLFFYRGSRGISLVVIHDVPNDGDGGAVTFEFDSLPAGGG